MEEPLRSQQEDAVYGYLESLRRNGQIISEEIISLVDGRVTAFVTVPAEGAWSALNNTRYTARHLADLAERFGCPPCWHRMGGEQPELPDWKESSWCYFKPGMEAGLSLREGLTGRSIPLYTLPWDPDRKERLIFHARNIDRLYRLWLNGVLEMEVWREMVDPLSPTVQRGRAIARDLEAVLERPVYYWLPRYYRFSGETERLRPCPGCGDSWQSGTFISTPEISFQCHPCRLVSEIGNCDDDTPAERIGYPVEFLPREAADQPAS